MDLTYQDYARLYPSYWTGETGRKIAKYGGPEAQLLGVYLMANHSANAIGLYCLPFRAIELPLDHKQLVAAFAALDRAGFATYDYGTEFVWVREMARIRLLWNSQNEQLPALAARDSRITLVNRLYSSVRGTPFVWAFFQKYGQVFRLGTGTKPRVSLVKSPLSPLPPRSRSRSGSEDQYRQPSN